MFDIHALMAYENKMSFWSPQHLMVLFGLSAGSVERWPDGLDPYDFDILRLIDRVGPTASARELTRYVYNVNMFPNYRDMRGVKLPAYLKEHFLAEDPTGMAVPAEVPDRITRCVSWMGERFRLAVLLSLEEEGLVSPDARGTEKVDVCTPFYLTRRAEILLVEEDGKYCFDTLEA